MRYIVTLLSPVIGDGTPIANPYRPQFSDDYPGLVWSDVTAQETQDQPGDPALIVLEVVTDAPEVLEADENYFVLEVNDDDSENSE